MKRINRGIRILTLMIHLKLSYKAAKSLVTIYEYMKDGDNT